MSFETIEFSRHSSTGLIKINRPKALNALNQQVLSELSQILNEIDTAKDLRALIITGEGEKAFVAGADIKEIHELNPEKALAFAERGQKLFRRLEVLRLPVIAAVNGFALGGGCELALACDFIYASENAKFGLPEVSLGIMPGFGGTQRLARQIGPAQARELTYSGKIITAQEALNIGLVNRVCGPSELLGKCFELTEMIATRAPVAVAKAKEVINAGYDADLDSGMELEREGFSDLFRTQDQVEGTKAFIEKRTPQFRGC